MMVRLMVCIALSTILVGCDAREPERMFQTLGSVEAPLVDRAEIVIENFRFSPEALVVEQGTVIVVKNLDEAGQSVVADTKKFDTEILGHNESAELVMDELGTFNFSSEPYPNILGRITVVQ